MDFMFHESIIAAKIHSLRDEVDSRRKEFVEASNGQYSENDSILVFDYRYGFNTEVDFRSKEAQEEVWNPADSYMVEVIARGIGEEYLWHTSYPKVAD